MRLSAHDATFVYTETSNGPMHGVSILVLDGPATYEEVLEFYRARIHMVPRLRQKLAYVPFNLAHPVWVDDDQFKLENHVRSHKVPLGTSQEDGIAAALELGEPMLDRTRPLWLLYVIEQVEGGTLLAQMSHHAFVDGATFVALSVALTDKSPDSEPPPEPEAWQPAPTPSSYQLWQDAAQDQATAAMDAMKKAAEIPALLRDAGTLMRRMSEPVLMAPWNAGMVGPKRKLAVYYTTVAAFKPIRNLLGGTINDVAITTISEAVARYLADRGEQVENQYLRIMCPVNVHDKDVDTKDLAGNRVSAMFPRLPAWPLGAKERHAEVLAEINGIKERREPEILDRLQHAQPPVPPVTMAPAQVVGTPLDWSSLTTQLPLPIMPNVGLRPQQAGFNFTVTNIPGPPWTQYVVGHQVKASIGTLMLGGNLGLGFALGSFDGKIVFNITCDPRLLPDIEKLRGHVQGVFEELQALAEE